ncbi:RHS repeat-associated core domain-containing protein [Catellatospora citrea]|uniref:Type IV secretion protein Rhs n=1 Tax=Catellatospora citrea TaxID=53366 RepID=A0A8J3KDB5_9ACTN|nr:RHS repeat-associated core domain-containing protein [Catellatospora citrea]RKE05615.1 RHS repeat-associated protein [Catellatospora citrea]GIF96968.1 type IV secretion protein Rhs [Catellatospora citrea]
MTIPRSWLVGATALSLVASLLGGAPARAETVAVPLVERPQTVPRSVAGTARPPVARPADPARPWTAAPTVTWPGASRDRLALPPRTAGSPATAMGAAERATAAPVLVRAGSAPVWVGAATGVSSVDVEVVDRAATGRAGVAGVLLRVERADGGQQAGTVQLRVDYAGFRHAFGGDYANRLGLYAMPDCALTTPEAAKCRRGTALPSTNDAAAGQIRGELAIGAASRVIALAAGSGGSTGDFKPTPLAPSATWQVGLQSGDFLWSYPIDVPDAPGLEPPVELSYTSGSVDGRTAATNNQPSWVGEGFDYHPGFIERAYKACKEDGQPGLGDNCYSTDNATIRMPGITGELVRDDTTGTWRSADDNGWRIERPAGAVNGDNDGEYWKLTSPDGTQYFFGRTAASGSAWTVPVFGNNAGEPCHAATFAASWCQQAWRWNLEYVLDPHGDAIAYYYTTEANHYALNLGAAVVPYIRGGYLDRIEYGLRDGVAGPAADRVRFTVADRCLSGANCVTTAPNDWPDTPLDQACGTTSCQVTSPTFWTEKRLASITTQVYSGGSYQSVDSWTLTHTFPDPQDGSSPTLWLESIVHTGLAGGTMSLPEVNFDGATGTDGHPLPNRVDATASGAPMYKWRIGKVRNESGGQINVTYAPHECVPGALPAADANTLRCFPAYWVPTGGSTPQLDWFHKPVVAKVTEADPIGGNATQVTEYDYLDGTAWSHDDSEMVPDSRKTWGQFRGFGRVRMRTGDASAGTQTLAEHRFLRGMDDDLKADGSRRNVWVTDSQGGQIEDKRPYAGFIRESTTYNGVGGPWLDNTVSEPALLAKTASRLRSSGPLEAWMMDRKSERERTALADGSVRTTEVKHTFDAYGELTQTDDRGDLSTTADDTCTRVTYARNVGAWLLDSPSRVETVAVGCDTTPSFPGDLISDQRYYYDGLTTWGAAPTKGDVTLSEEAASFSGGTPVYARTSKLTVDVYGRTVVSEDALGNQRTTAYTPAVGGPITSVATTNALGHTSTATLDPLTGMALTSVDANGRRTDADYDPLRRIVKVWRPDRSKAANQSPHVQYAYTVSNTVPSVVTTQTLLATGSYATSYSITDGFLRVRQTQSPSPLAAGGRVIDDTFYDTAGREWKSSKGYWNASAASPALFIASEVDLPAHSKTLYDGAGREVAELFMSHGVEKWRSTTTYGGNWVAVDPPPGATANQRFFDADDQIVELRQFTGGAPTGAYDATKYTYTPSGKVATVTDPSGNVWRHVYDLRDREISTVDPDTGTSTATYDDEDRLLTSTDSRGQKLAYTYDALGRRTGQFATSTSGTKLAEWVYDTLPGGKGLATSSTRFVGADGYTSAVTGYDVAGRATGTSMTIPTTETGLGGTYTVTNTYNAAGQALATALPAAGGLPAETLRHTYTALGLPSTLGGVSPYVTQTLYTEFGETSRITGGASGKQITRSFVRDESTRRVIRSTVDRQTATLPAVTDLNYTYDQAGNLTKIADTPAGATPDVQCFNYDHLQRLTEAWTATDGCAGAPSTSILGPSAPYWSSYTFDRTGNRLSETAHAAAGDTVANYTYPAAGAAQPHTLRSVAISGPGVSRTDTFGYDVAGNTTARTVAGAGQVLAWDAEGHLASVTSGSNVTSFLYDADGNRLIRRDPDGSATLYLGGLELRRTGTSGAVTGTRYYDYGGVTIAIRTPSALRWLATDHHGTGEATIDATTLAVTIRRHTPFGGSRGTPPGSWPGERGFVGGAKDPTGLIHLGAREYDPMTGRFISADPVLDATDPQQLNGYAYANNSPVSFSDPDGLKTTCDATCQYWKAYAAHQKKIYEQQQAAKRKAAAAAARARAIQAQQAKARAKALAAAWKREQKRKQEAIKREAARWTHAAKNYDKRVKAEKEAKQRAAACDAKCRKESSCKFSVCRAQNSAPKPTKVARPKARPSPMPGIAPPLRPKPAPQWDCDACEVAGDVIGEAAGAVGDWGTKVWNDPMRHVKGVTFGAAAGAGAGGAVGLAVGCIGGFFTAGLSCAAGAGAGAAVGGVWGGIMGGIRGSDDWFPDQEIMF